jgi:hypothetical protein
MSDSSAFRYVDTAIGGVNRRNNPMRLEDFHPPAGAVDVYTTAVLYDDGLPAHWREHRNAAGRRSVAGYRGACYADGFFSDFDSDGDLGRALDDVRRFVCFLMYEEDVPAEAIRIVFSGRKGFHVEVPNTLFGGFEPDANLPARLGVLAEHWATRAGLTTLDLSVYRHLNLFRVPNTKNGKTGLYAIELTATEIQVLDADTIRTLAHEPRRLEWLPADEFLTRDTLRELWQRTAGAARSQPPTTEREPGATVPLGKRHPYLISLNAMLERKGVSAAGRLAMLRAANATELAEPLDDAEIVSIAAHDHPDGDREDWYGDGDQPPEPFDQAETIAALRHDLEQARSRIARLERYGETLLQEREQIRLIAEERRHELVTIYDICKSPDMEPKRKFPLILFYLAGKHDPRFRDAYDQPVPICIDQVREMAGNVDRKTASGWIHDLDHDRAITLHRTPTIKVIDGRRIPTTKLSVQLHPPDETTLDAAIRRLVHPPEDAAVRRKAYGAKQTKPRCPEHPNAPLRREWYCTVDGKHVGTDQVEPPLGNLSAPTTEEKVGKLWTVAPAAAEPIQVGPLGNISPVVCNCGTPLDAGEACHVCQISACHECGAYVEGTLYRFCRAVCLGGRSNRPERYDSPPRELVQEYAATPMQEDARE